MNAGSALARDPHIAGPWAPTLGSPEAEDTAAADDGLGFDADLETEAADDGFAGAAATALRGEESAALPACADDTQLAAWISAIARQDERALGALYDATCHRVHGLALRIVQRGALAEEVVEDTFWQVWRQAPRYDATRGRPLTWLLAMARSRAIDTLRRDQRFRHDELPEDDVADAGSAAPPPQDLLDATRGHAALHAALERIEPRSRQLVALAFFRGWTHEEIAEQQGMPLGTVKSLIRRALIALRQHLAEAGDAR